MTNVIDKIYYCWTEFSVWWWGSWASSWSWAPSTAPQNIWDVYIDTDNDNIYQAVWTSSVADWIWINTRPKCGFIDILMVWWGWDGWDGYWYNQSNYYSYWWWGGGGRVIWLQRFWINSGVFEIKTQENCWRGKDLCWFWLIAYWWGHWWGTCMWCRAGCKPTCWWNWGWAWGASGSGTNKPQTMDGGYSGWETCTWSSGYITWAWGWAWWGGCWWNASRQNWCCNCVCWWDWWPCIVSDISWQSVCYAWWWGWGTWVAGLWWCWFWVWWNWWGWSYSGNRQAVDACCCWSWWWGGVNLAETAYNYRWHWWCPILILRYKLDWSCWIREACWWDITCCDGYKIHTYDSGTQDLFFRFNN